MKTKQFVLLLTLLALSAFTSMAQMSATFTKTLNYQCGGVDCNWTGPSILINEIMASPSVGDGCLSGTGGTGCGGEWIELYNPNLCQPVDISCYYLGATTPNSEKEAFLIPSGTIVPPGGFCVIRGYSTDPIAPSKLVQNGGNVVEIVIPQAINGDGMCVAAGGIIPLPPQRFWFPNAAGGWFAFYDRNGVPQDAVYWGPESGVLAGQPCVPTRTNCNNSVTSLAAFASIPADRKNQIHAGTLPDGWGRSFRRFPDAGAWEIVTNTGTYSVTPSPGDCNGTCAQPVASSTCDGTATINVTGGTAPYSYSWNDSEGQLTQTATGLCPGTYVVTVTDAAHNTQTFSVTIDEYVPTVTFNMNQNVCEGGQPVNFTGFSPTPSTGQTGTFTGTGVTGSSFNPATAGVGSFPITYTFKDENGCENTATGNITVNPNPTPTISGVDPEYCLSNVTVTPTLTPAGGTLSGPGVSNNQFNVLTAGVGSHTLTYSVTQNGCTGTATVTVNVTGTTPPVFTIQDEICLNAAPIPLTGTPAGGAFAVGTQTITEFNPQVHGVGTHTVTYTITDPNNPQCLAQASDNITVIDGAQFTASIPTLFCYGSPNYFVNIQPTGGTLTGTLVTGDSLMIKTAAPGDYSLTYNYTSPQGCSGTYAHNFKVDVPLSVDFTVVEGCFQELTFTASKGAGSGDFTSYEWSEAGQPVGIGNPFVMTEDEVGMHTYTLIAKNANGCAATAQHSIEVHPGVDAESLVIPNVITANKDGVNDFITFPLMDNDCIVYDVVIVNRWGQTVFIADKDHPTFDGKTKAGNELSEGVYFYKIVTESFNCKEEPFKSKCHGFITITK